MSDKPRIPAWQSATNASTEKPAASTPEPESEPAKENETVDTKPPVVEAPVPTEGDLEDSESTQLLEQASRFLEDPAIRDAPREKKVAFLESKGVGAEDIETLLGAATQEDNSMDLEAVGRRAWTTVSSLKMDSRARRHGRILASRLRKTRSDNHSHRHRLHKAHNLY